MKTMQGAGDLPGAVRGRSRRRSTTSGIAGWAAGLGYKGMQIPTWDGRLIDLKKAAASKAYCDEIKGICREAGVEITELSTHLQGQLVAVHPAYDEAFDGFAAPEVRGNPKARQAWAVDQVKGGARPRAISASSVMRPSPARSAWPFMYPWPQRPAGLVETAFDELAKRWRPILDASTRPASTSATRSIPARTCIDGVTFEMFLEAMRPSPALPASTTIRRTSCCSSSTISSSSTSITSASSAFHVKDAEFNPTGRQGVYGGYQPWVKRAGRFRSLGDGQVDFAGIFSKLAEYDYDGWAVLEWECCLKHPEQGAAEGAPFIAGHIIRVTEQGLRRFRRGRHGRGGQPADAGHRGLREDAS